MATTATTGRAARGKGCTLMIDVKGKNVYLSGPMTGIDRFNVEAFAAAHAELKMFGVGYVFNPAIRYLVMGADKLAEMEHEDFMLDTIHELTMRERRSQEWVRTLPRKYDMVLTLPGWQKSPGAKAEVYAARACGIPVHELHEAVGE